MSFRLGVEEEETDGLMGTSIITPNLRADLRLVGGGGVGEGPGEGRAEAVMTEGAEEGKDVEGEKGLKGRWDGRMGLPLASFRVFRMELTFLSLDVSAL